MICDRWQACVKSQFIEGTLPICVNQNRDHCIESSDCRSKVKCEEKRKWYILENTKKERVLCYKMDGGIILQDRLVPEGTCKCDYVLFTGGLKGKVILVELKGVDVAHALKQLSGTLLLFRTFFQTFSQVHGRIVVTSMAPNIKATPDYVNLVRFLRKNFHGTIKITERELMEKDIELGE